MGEMDAILIAGPTASGKSALAMELAARHGGVVVNADSMQVYDALPILTARPTDADMAAVEHRLYGHVPVETAYSTGAWYRDAAIVLDEIAAAGRIPVVVGGTGLYFRALMGGLAEMPEIPTELRAYWRSRLVGEGAGALHRELARADPETAGRLDISDGQRIVRALEVLDATGLSIRVHQQQKAGRALVDADRALKLLVVANRQTLHRRIAKRFDGMIEAGALDEVRALQQRRLDPRLPAMRAIGVSQLQGVLQGKFKVVEAKEKSIIASRQYAKRQMTWFRNQLDRTWRHIQGPESLGLREISRRELKIT